MKGFGWKWRLPAGDAEHPIPDEALPHVSQLPSLLLALGARGSGKTALGFRMLELFEHHASQKYVVGLPKAAQALLPNWIKHIDSLLTLPDNAVALVDEAHLNLGANLGTTDRRELASMLALSRQRNQTVILVSQQARTISREIVAAADVLLIKNMRNNQISFERPELAEVLTKARAKLQTVLGDRRPFTYFYALDDGLHHRLKSEIPGFWSEPLSRSYSAHTPPKSLSDEVIERRLR